MHKRRKTKLKVYYSTNIEGCGTVLVAVEDRRMVMDLARRLVGRHLNVVTLLEGAKFVELDTTRPGGIILQETKKRISLRR